MFDRKKAAVAAMIVVALAGIMGLVVHQVSADASTYSSRTQISVAGSTIPYQADPSGACFGEDITLTSGTVQITSHGTMNQNGFHGTFDVVRQGIHGVGAQTGTQYVLVGTDNVSQSQNVDGAFTSTFTDHINIVGQGPDNNAVLSSTFHITVTPNGDISARVGDFSITCH